ncbi:MAG: T9SS type A sorting domain-containing protein [Bacteroidota bacterium]
MKRFILLFITAFLILNYGMGQERISGLFTNPVIKHALKEESSMAAEAIGELIYPEPIPLPFFDDFHTGNIFPSPALFIDNDAFINDAFPYRSVNIGAATLDAIDASGELYPDASMFPFIADHLTSRPIRLDTLFLPGETRAITLADSLYFSFYYQPQGRGNQPEPDDSLVLQFGYYAGDSVFAYMDSITVAASSYLFDPTDTIFPLDTLYAPQECNPGVYMISFDTIVWEDMITLPCDSVYEPAINWEHVWSSEGMSVDGFYSKFNTYSRQVIIPVNDSTKFYKKHFYFRFYNYASLAPDINPSWKSNCDQWNIDYIYLDVDRSAADTFYKAISFAERAPSFLKEYTAMPLRQYRNNSTNQLKDSLKLYITNLSADTFNVYYEYIVDEIGGTFTHTYNGGFANLYPFFNNAYQSCDEVPQHACPPRDLLFPLSSQADSSSYNVRHIIHDQSNPDLGDTIHFIQKFYNYYAYDDGTPEAGYGLSLSGGKAACKYSLDLADSLVGIAMFFNRVQNDQNDQFFHLKVWDNNNGQPGDVILEMSDLKPKFSEELYRMQVYQIDPPLPVMGTIFIGFEQTTSDLLNVGFDKHYDASENLFFNTDGTWQQSLKAGALIMRPVLYDFYDPFSIPETLPGSSWNIYPNPATHGVLHFENDLLTAHELISTGTRISIYDLLGRSIIRQPYSHTIHTGNIPDGLYIIHIANEQGSIDHIHKVLINN